MKIQVLFLTLLAVLISALADTAHVNADGSVGGDNKVDCDSVCKTQVAQAKEQLIKEAEGLRAEIQAANDKTSVLQKRLADVTKKHADAHRDSVTHKNDALEAQNKVQDMTKKMSHMQDALDEFNTHYILINTALIKQDMKKLLIKMGLSKDE